MLVLVPGCNFYNAKNTPIGAEDIKINPTKGHQSIAYRETVRSRGVANTNASYFRKCTFRSGLQFFRILKFADESGGGWSGL